MKFRVLTIDFQEPRANYLIECDPEDGSHPVKHWVKCGYSLPFGCWFRGELDTNVSEDEFYKFTPGNTVI